MSFFLSQNCPLIVRSWSLAPFVVAVVVGDYPAEGVVVVVVDVGDGHDAAVAAFFEASPSGAMWHVKIHSGSSVAEIVVAVRILLVHVQAQPK